MLVNNCTNLIILTYFLIGNTKNKIFLSSSQTVILLMVGFKKLFLWQKNKDPVSGTLLCIIYYLFYTLSVCNDVYSNVLSCMSAYCNVLSKNVPLAFWTIKLNHYNTISICDNILARSLTDFWRSDWFLKKWLIFVKRLIDDVINLPIKRTLRRYQSITSRVDLRKQL